MEEEFRSGQMEAGTMVFGEMEWLTATEGSFMLKVTCMKESGPTIKQTALEFILTSTAAGMKASGTWINSMASEWSSGQMEPSMKATMNRA